MLEIGFLSLAGSPGTSMPDIWLNPGISFVATLQTMQFTHLEDLTYTSVMTTGNLRRAAHGLFAGLIPAHAAKPLRDARLLGTISLSFLVGALLGAYATRRFHDLALWVVTALMLAALASILTTARRSKR